MSVVFEAGKIIVTLGKRVAHVPCVSEGDTAIVSLDEVSEWHVPAGEEISIAELARLTVLIEKAFDDLGQDVEFE